MKMSHCVPTHIVQKMNLFMLWLIDKKELHGYELMKLLQKEGMRGVSPSRCYPILNSLHQERLITQKEKKQGKRIRKVYALTAKGKKRLGEGKKMFRGVVREFLKEMIS